MGNKKGTNYFKDKYDTSSDEFQNSLLKHEGQHFFDLKNHPKMQSTDLEYRAKLTELIYSKDIEDLLISYLARMGDSKVDTDRSHPHSYAERKIVQALSERIFGRELEMNHDLWRAESERIPVVSLELLKEHSEKLRDWDGESFVI